MGSGFHFFFPGSHFGAQNLNPKMGSGIDFFFFLASREFLRLGRHSIHTPAHSFVIDAAQQVATEEAPSRATGFGI